MEPPWAPPGVKVPCHLSVNVTVSNVLVLILLVVGYKMVMFQIP